MTSPTIRWGPRDWSSDPAPLIDLVAVAYQAPLETARFLDSLATHMDVPFTLTVIDNNSPDVDVRDVLKLGFSRLIDHPNFCGGNLHFNLENVGYARACNDGAALGEAPVIGLLNCDVQWTPGAGKALVDALLTNTEVGVVGPKTTTYESHPLRRPKLTHAGIQRNSAGRDEHRFWMREDDGRADDILSVPTVSGATYFIKRAVWQELTECPKYQQVAPGATGAFLPTQHYYEETFCSYHTRAHGYEIVYRGDICMIHEWHKSSVVGGARDQLFRESEDYFRKACSAHAIQLTW